MLVITRVEGSCFTMTDKSGQVVTIQVIRARDGSARIGIDAPRDVAVRRDDMKKEVVR